MNHTAIHLASKTYHILPKGVRFIIDYWTLLQDNLIKLFLLNKGPFANHMDGNETGSPCYLN